MYINIITSIMQYTEVANKSEKCDSDMKHKYKCDSINTKKTTAYSICT